MKKIVISIFCMYISQLQIIVSCPTCTHDTYSSVPFFVPQIVQYDSIDSNDPIFKELFDQKEETDHE